MQSIESHNSKTIDNSTPRASFVSNNHRCFDLLMNQQWPENELKIPRHPENEKMGYRIWPTPLEGNKILIQSEDIENEFRLKEFANVFVDDKSLQTDGFERVDRRPIVHWLLENHSIPASLYKIEGDKIVQHDGRIEIGNFSTGDVVQLERVGFARITEISEEGKIKLIYLHE